MEIARPTLPLRLATPALVALVALAAPARAAGAGSPPEERRVRAELSLGAFRLDYTEFTPDGRFLDGETGWIPTIAGTLELRGGRGFFRAAARLARGEVDYRGHVQSRDPALDGFPARTVSDAQFVLVELQAGPFVDPRRVLAVFAGFAARRWDRDIRGTTIAPPGGPPVRVSGLSEIYTWYELQGGLRVTFLRTAGWEGEIEGRVARTAAATMEVDIGRRVALDLGERFGFRGGATVRRALGRDLHLALGGHAEGYEFGQSPVVLLDPADPSSGILEPRSETVGVVVELGIGGRF